ncbi:MAG: hypothetical protein Q9195_000772, partial [Heterodermia aff. obscurata]
MVNDTVFYGLIAYDVLIRVLKKIGINKYIRLFSTTIFLITNFLLNDNLMSKTMPSLDKDRINISVKRARDLLGAAAKASLSQRQKASLKAVKVKEPVWISEIELSSPAEDDLRQVLLKAIQDLSEGNEIIDLPRSFPVGAEWIGRRLEQNDDDGSGTSLTEEDKYSILYSQTSDEIVILYVHGGGN